MINVVCRCSHRWEAPDDMAGLPSQCAKCGLLVDVPTLSDMPGIEGDGTYRLDEVQVPPPNSHLAELTSVYHPGRTRPDGTPIDLRGPAVPSTRPSGPGSEPPAALRPVPLDRPRYDPETGELIQPLDIRQASYTPAPEAPASLPVARKIINYNVSSEDTSGAPTGVRVFIALFQPINVIVMGVIFLGHLFLLMASTVTMALLVTIPIPFVIIAGLMGHYVAVLEETGPDEKDELPRPLRDVHPYDDFIAPFMTMSAALLLAYWPVVAVLLLNAVAASTGRILPFPHALPYLLGSFVLGCIAFPALFLTLVTSGSIANLRPDRVSSVVTSLGFRYLALTLLWMVASACYLVGFVGTIAHVVAVFGSGPVTWLDRSYVAYPLLLAGIYLTHSFCWLLGLEYRRAYPRFSWTHQKHPRLPTAVVKPPLHPKLTAAEEQSRQRALRRQRSEIR